MNSASLNIAERLRQGAMLNPAPAAFVQTFAPRRLRAHFEATQPPATLARIGALEARLARTSAEVRLAQALRYRVFYQELGATADAVTRLMRRDADRFDRACDHVLVIDHEARPPRNAVGMRRPAVVGTYRMLRQDQALIAGGFYTAQEFDIAPMLARMPSARFLELGRSCVLASHRNKRTLEALWAGVWAYIRHYRVDAMIGCASFPGTDPRAHALALSFLHHHAASSGEWRVRAHERLRVPMDMMGREEAGGREALRALPPLIKGYLRLGAGVGDGAVVDAQFGTVDVCMVLPTAGINPRYFGHFGAPDAQAAA